MGREAERLILDFYVYFLPLGPITFNPKKKKKGHMRRHLTIFFFFSFSDLLTDIDGKVTLTTKSKLQ
jgi:hypothetical protein